MRQTFIKQLLLVAASTLLALCGVFLIGLAFLINSRTLRYAPQPVPEIHVRHETVTTRKGPVYVAEAGSKVVAKEGGVVHALAGSVIEAHAGSRVIAQAGCKVIAFNGARVSCMKGSCVTIYGNPKVDAFDGSTVFDFGRLSEVDAYQGSVVYANTEGAKIKAFAGSVVFAQSRFDDATHVNAYEGSLVYAYEGTEVFAYGATVHVLKGGEVHATKRCTIYWYPGAEGWVDPDCQLINRDSEPAESNLQLKPVTQNQTD
jgi:hypothetical protein